MRGALTALYTVVSFVFFGIIAITLSLITGNSNWAHGIARAWSRSVLFVAGVKTRVEGLKHLKGQGPIIICSNHASQFDIPVLTALLPVQFRFVVKEELFRIPLFGLAMRRAGYIPINRKGGKAAMASLKRAAETVKKGTSVVIFPEGTRSPDGRLRPFKTGAILLGLKAGRPFVPVGISGSHRILPKGEVLPKGGEVVVRIGRPMEAPSRLDAKGREELVARIWTEVSRLLDDDNRPAPAGPRA